jgi:hypothetical protein
MPQLAEFLRIYRHWGHPTVDDESLGYEKERTIGTFRSDPISTTALRVTGAVKHQFIASFIVKRGCWPKVILP